MTDTPPPPASEPGTWQPPAVKIHGIYPLQRYIPEFGASAVNAFDVDAWLKATTLTWLGLRLVVRRGAVRVAIQHIDAEGTCEVIAQLEQTGVGSIDLAPLKLSDHPGALLPVLQEASEDAVFDLLFASDDAPVTPQPRINYIFCTYKRAEYVQHNAGVFRDYLRRHRAEAEAHLTVIDNGSEAGSNDCGVQPDADVTVLANNNTGGAGGFGRGIYESCYGALIAQGFSHVCLLDDDIYLHPEMFARNTAFIRYLKPGFHVGAPMYPTSSEQKIPRISACFGHKHRGGLHPSDQALGGGLDTRNIADFIRMDRAPDSTGWWWNCIAVEDIHRIGLPYPFFIKMDDVEYSMRLKEAGVDLVIPFSFWVLHDDFEEKYSAAMQYFRFRNRWLMSLQNGWQGTAPEFALGYDWLVRQFVFQRKYEHAQLLLDGMADLLQGPEHLVRHEKDILARTFARVRREKNGPMPQPPAGSTVANGRPAPEDPGANERSWNNHFRPLQAHLTIDTTKPFKLSDCRDGQDVSYWNGKKGLGYTVQRDRARALRQMLQLRQLRRHIARDLPEVAARYQAAKAYLTTPAFWAAYGKFGQTPRLQVTSADTQALRDNARAQAQAQVARTRARAEAQTPVTSADLAFLNGLRNRYLGQRCFVLGNGPSLTVPDLELLKGEVTFAANKIYLCYDQTSWRPTFYSVEDLLVAQNSRAEILALQDSTKIFAHHMLPYLPRQANHHYARWLPPADNRSPFREFSSDLTKGICWGSTITYSMLQMAVHMGFKQIYILGLDHSYVEPKTKQDGALVSEGEVNHFHPDYRKPGEKWHYPVLDRLEQSYQFAKDYCDSLGVEVYNASRFSKLEIFPRADLDAVLAD